MSCCDPAKCTFGDTKPVHFFFSCNLSHCELHFFSATFWDSVAVYIFFQMRLLSLQSVHFEIKSVFSDAIYFAAKCTFWDQVCVFSCNLCCCKVYILGSSLFSAATFVAAKCTFWDQVCVLRCDLCRCKVYILGSSLCFENRPLSLQSVHFGIKFVF